MTLNIITMKLSHIPTFDDGDMSSKPPKNPTIQALFHEIINDSPEDIDQNTAPSISRATPQKILSIVPQRKVKPTPPKIVAEVFPRTKEDIIGYNDTGEEDRKIEESSNTTITGESENEDSDAESEDMHPEEKFLPATPDGLCKRLRKLWREFMQEGKHEHRNT